MLPLSATLASDSFFKAFQDDSKLKALLHGHSYTAHAIGCSAANTALDMYTDPACNPNLQGSPQESPAGFAQLRELWDETLVQQLSRHERVQKLVVLGMPQQRPLPCELAYCNCKFVLLVFKMYHAGQHVRSCRLLHVSTILVGIMMSLVHDSPLDEALLFSS